MILLEATLIANLAVLFVNASISDISNGIIKNRSIIISLLIGIICLIPYYVFFATDCVITYLVNSAICCFISVFLYLLGIWGAGDSKLLITAILCFPARLYCNGKSNIVSGFKMIVIVFTLAFLYLIIETIYLGIKEHNLFSVPKGKISFGKFLQSILFFFLFLNTFNSIVARFIPAQLLSDKTLTFSIHFVLVLCAIYWNKKVNWMIIAAFGVASIALLMLNGIHFSVSNMNWKIYPMVALLFVFRIISNKYNYKSILVSELKPGMILSTGSIISFSRSRVKGLPTYTSEDLKSRLSRDEVDSIIRWSKTKKGKDSLVIVRKMPFALFISIGTVIFAMMEVLLK